MITNENPVADCKQCLYAKKRKMPRKTLLDYTACSKENVVDDLQVINNQIHCPHYVEWISIYAEFNFGEYKEGVEEISVLILSKYLTGDLIHFKDLLELYDGKKTKVELWQTLELMIDNHMLTTVKFKSIKSEPFKPLFLTEKGVDFVERLL